jgi:mRNA-degrading endonuclease toxin of MazEF toxin-antitoxin module
VRRGAVYEIPLDLPDWEDGGYDEVERDKLVVVLRDPGTPRRESYVPVVLASTRRREQVARYEVLVEPAEGGFDDETILDCRWVYTLPWHLFYGEPLFELPLDMMEVVSAALVVGLQINPTFYTD